MNFDFNNPELLWLLLGVPLLAILRSRSGKSGTVIFSSVAIAKAAASKNRARAGSLLFSLRLLALALLIVAIARPRLGEGYSIKEESGIDIVLAVDVSGSMSALDFSEGPADILTRLDAVKGVVKKFIDKRPNDRIGMIAFATNPFLVSPITLNHDWLLRNIDRLEIGVIDGNRTAIGSAVAMSVNRLRELKNSKSKVIILLTDGENNSGSITPLAAAEAAKAYDIKIYTIAAGTSGIVPMARLDRNQQLMRDASGRPVYGGNAQSEMDDKTLKEISKLTDGKFFRAQDVAQLRDIYDSIDRLEKTAVKLKNFTSYTELFRYFAAAALAMLALEQLLGNTRYRSLP